MAEYTPGQQQQQLFDLDAFLTSMESKLRVPFSSLDLAKTISTPALRRGYSAAQYLECLEKVLARTDKVIRMRALIGLLGVLTSTAGGGIINGNNNFNGISAANQHDTEEDSSRLDLYVARIVKAAQEAPLHEEWVRTIAGLVQGKLYYKNHHDDDDDSENDNNNGERDRHKGKSYDEEDQNLSCWGDEVNNLLKKTCEDIVTESLLRNVEQSTKAPINRNGLENITTEDTPGSNVLLQDTDPTFAPYRYALLKPNFLSKAIPAAMSCEQHFKPNSTVPLLSIDDQMEKAKWQEEFDQLKKAPGIAVTGSKSDLSAATTTAAAVTNKTTVAQRPQTILPGQRSKVAAASTASKLAAQQQAKKASMFMPTNKKPQIFNTNSTTKPGMLKSKTPLKTSLHVRKAGASLALIGKGRKVQLTNNDESGNSAPTTSTATSTSAATNAAVNNSDTVEAKRAKLLGAAKLKLSNNSNTNGGVRGRAMANRLSGSKNSKMKMLDVNEVQTLETEKKDEAIPAAKLNRRGAKRKLSEHTDVGSLFINNSSSLLNTAHQNGNDNSTAAASDSNMTDDHPDGNDSVSKDASHISQFVDHGDDEEHPIDAAAAARALVSGALSAYQAQLQAATTLVPPQTQIQQHKQQQQLQQLQNQKQQPNQAHANQPGHHHRTLDWKELLATRSNKLSDTDRIRIAQFFEQKYNPTPDQTKVKIKLHEDRNTVDLVTGGPAKETYYLELDYTTFTSKQSKKTKRYDK